MLWLVGIVTLPCFTLAYFVRSVPLLLYTLVIVGVVPVLTTCGGFAYFALRSPEKLQSEDYQLRHEELQLRQQKTCIEALGLEIRSAMANPETPYLPPASGS